METLETRINNGFKQIAENYKNLLVFIDGEIKKGYDNEFWERMKEETKEKLERAAYQIKN